MFLYCKYDKQRFVRIKKERKRKGIKLIAINKLQIIVICINFGSILLYTHEMYSNYEVKRCRILNYIELSYL